MYAMTLLTKFVLLHRLFRRWQCKENGPGRCTTRDPKHPSRAWSVERSPGQVPEGERDNWGPLWEQFLLCRGSAGQSTGFPRASRITEIVKAVGYLCLFLNIIEFFGNKAPGDRNRPGEGQGSDDTLLVSSNDAVRGCVRNRCRHCDRNSCLIGQHPSPTSCFPSSSPFDTYRYSFPSAHLHRSRSGAEGKLRWKGIMSIRRFR